MARIDVLVISASVMAAMAISACGSPGPGPHPGEMEGVIWNDSTIVDGHKDANEPALAVGVTVELFADDGDGVAEPALDGPVPGQPAQTPNAEGGFLFKKVPPSEYFVRVTGAPVGPPEVCSAVLSVSATGGAHFDFALEPAAVPSCF